MSAGAEVLKPFLEHLSDIIVEESRCDPAVLEEKRESLTLASLIDAPIPGHGDPGDPQHTMICFHIVASVGHAQFPGGNAPRAVRAHLKMLRASGCPTALLPDRKALEIVVWWYLLAPDADAAFIELDNRMNRHPTQFGKPCAACGFVPPPEDAAKPCERCGTAPAARPN